MIRALSTLVIVLLLCRGPAGAQELPTVFTKLNPVVVEYWDQDGIFHVVNADLVLVSDVGRPLPSKSVFERIQKALAAMPYERFAATNAASTIKTVAFDVIRRENNGENVKEVLVGKMLIR